jgi:hypothetical protein
VETVIRAASGEVDVAAVRALFDEYAREIATDLCFQGFAQERAGLPGASTCGPRHVGRDPDGGSPSP